MGKLEQIEGIELLRSIENNQSIGTFISKSTSFSVDVNDDLLKAINVMPNNPIRKNISEIKKKIYLFDLDGVLIDSKKNMQLSWNELSVKNNINVPFSNYFSLIGLPFIQILKKLKIKQKYFKNIEYDFKGQFDKKS